MIKGFQRWTNPILGVLIGFFIFGFLIWGAADKSLNLVGLLNDHHAKGCSNHTGCICRNTLRKIWCGQHSHRRYDAGRCVGCIVGSITQNLWIGMLAGMVTGSLMALLLALLSIKYKTNQIIAGTVINILSMGLTSYISARFIQVYQSLNSPGTFPVWKIPLLAKIPIIGPVFFQNSIFVYLMLILMVVIHIALFYTRWGLRVRAVGEHPKAADTLGLMCSKHDISLLCWEVLWLDLVVRSLPLGQ